MKASTKRTLMSLTSLAFLITAVYIYFALIKPSYTGILGLASERASKEENVKNFSSLNNEFQKLSNEYKNIDELKERVSIFIPSGIALSYVMNQLTGIARLNNMAIQSFSLKPMAVKPTKSLVRGLGTLRVELKMVGSYENLKSFIKNTETNFLIADIVSFKIDAQQNSSDLLIITAVIDTYYQT